MVLILLAKFHFQIKLGGIVGSEWFFMQKITFSIGLIFLNASMKKNHEMKQQKHFIQHYKIYEILVSLQFIFTLFQFMPKSLCRIWIFFNNKTNQFFLLLKADYSNLQHLLNQILLHLILVLKWKI